MQTVSSLKENIKLLNDLIIDNKTLEAMERFYAETVTMQENEEEPRRGKAFCIEHEKRNLERMTFVSSRLLNQAIDETKQVVFGEWEFIFSSKKGQTFRLTEVSVQQWENGFIIQEKFYYKDIIPL